MRIYVEDFKEAMDEIDNRNVREIFNIVNNYFCREVSYDNIISLYKIKKYLNKKNIIYTDDELNTVLSILQCEFSLIVRHDTYSGEVYYQKLNERYQDSKYSSKFYSFCDDINYIDKRFVLLSDSHIGNNRLQSFDIINSVYKYCSDNNVKLVFNIGEIFDKLDDNSYKTFINNYPNIDNIRTYSICSNNIKKINRDKNLFNVYNRDSINIKFNEVSFKFRNRLKLNKADNNYSVCIAGNVNRGKIHMSEYTCFINVPSTSLININNVVGYNIELINNISGVLDIMVITELYCDNNYNIEERNIYEYKFNHNNKVLVK